MTMVQHFLCGRRGLLAAALTSLALLAAPAAAEPVSPWARDGAARMRLVDAGAGSAPGARLAAIVLRLDAGWKTYWRQPGDSGVPPLFDFSRSTNVASAVVAYPTPERQSDADGVINVYRGEVLLPVTVTPRDPAKPVRLALVADYGVCDKVCIPTHSEAVLDLAPSGGAPGPAALAARRAAEAVPKPAVLGADGVLAVLSARHGPPVGGKAAVEIRARTPANLPSSAPAPILFAETGEGGFAPAPERLEGAAEGEAAFRIVFDTAEPPASGLRLTLAAGGHAVETAVALDAIGPRP